MGLAQPLISATPGVTAAGESALGTEPQPPSPVWGQGRGGGAHGAAQGNLSQLEQGRMAWPSPPRPCALAAWHVSLLPTACQKNSLAAWKRARLSRQRILTILTLPGEGWLSSLCKQTVVLPPRHPPRRSTPQRGGSCVALGLEQPLLGQSILHPPPSPVPSPQAEREGLSPGVLGEAGAGSGLLMLEHREW